MNNTSDSRKLPWFESISGPELSNERCSNLTGKLGVENLYGIMSPVSKTRVTISCQKLGDEEYQTKTVIIATGAKHRHIGVAGEEGTTAVRCFLLCGVRWCLLHR